MLTSRLADRKKITIQGSEVVETLESDAEDDYRAYGIEFLKTPKGRRKQLLTIVENFDKEGRAEHITLNMENIVTDDERRKLLKHTLRNAVLDLRTRNALMLPFAEKIDMLSIILKEQTKGGK